MWREIVVLVVLVFGHSFQLDQFSEAGKCLIIILGVIQWPTESFGKLTQNWLRKTNL